ncbi:MAG: TIM-barrel domain-containing protein, partial [Candidatus Spyradocola sp.]
MKFSDGYWLNQPGYDLFYASVPYEIDVTEHAIHVLATQVLTSRGDTLQGPVLDVYFSSTLENTIRVKVEHYRGARKKGPEFQLNAQEGFAPVTRETDEYAELISGKTRVRITKGKGWQIEYYYEDRLLTKEGWRSTSYIAEAPYHTQERMLAQKNFNRFFADDQDEATAYTRGQLNLSVGESIYGFGEKFTTFVKNGQKVEMWNSDGGTCTEYSYKSIPFYVSNRSYGVFVNHSEKVSFEVGSDTVSKVSFTVPGERLEYIVIGGKNIADVLVNYTNLTGKPALPPAYSFGLWLTTSFTTDYDEKTVSSFVDGMAERNIPLQVFHFDCFWMQEFRWCDFVWDKRMFPDPKGFIQRLKARGLQVCVWVNPYIGQQGAIFDEAAEKGYLVMMKNGDVFQTD